MMRVSGLLLCLGLVGCGWNPFGGQTFQALVTDQAGLPLAGAVASSGGHAAIADENGRVELRGVTGRVWVQKTGYGRLEVDARTGAVTLAKRQAPIKIIWDERFNSGLKMDGIKGYLQARGYEVQTLTGGSLPEDADVLVLACPGWFNEEAYTGYMRQAYSGTKLVLLGEWGGFDGVDLAALSSIASKAGISFESGQVRIYGSGGQAQNWLSLEQISPKSLSAGLSGGVTVFTAGVLKLEESAKPVLTSTPEAIRILRWEVGPQTVAAMGPLGRSQVLAIADSSLWSDEAGPEGKPQWQASNNARFAENVMGW